MNDPTSWTDAVSFVPGSIDDDVTAEAMLSALHHLLYRNVMPKARVGHNGGGRGSARTVVQVRGPMKAGTRFAPILCSLDGQRKAGKLFTTEHVTTPSYPEGFVLAVDEAGAYHIDAQDVCDFRNHDPIFSPAMEHGAWGYSVLLDQAPLDWRECSFPSSDRYQRWISGLWTPDEHGHIKRVGAR